ncbi:hypothetical protein BSR29_03395 [Boudabousia liubingyangii]|uniref:HTH lacI-type domain-containing protein n=1 Tax=Boudabousia liubingyangii TaxID=1921764 RepID=A0A1Q5PMX7_9ACTO|nr:LacI family DNA-binding transcriptional regulator [Boudabousia liubingyangii]OKL48904.1 hypothetical protein BSR29_03395 [Boudabousia liubingyangii]
MATRVRLDDVAKLAGVSTATVSRVINGSSQVRKETAQAVLTAIDTLGYDRPGFLTNPAQTAIGLVVPELINPIFAEFAHTLQLELAHRGHPTLICSQAPGGSTEAELVETLCDNAGVAGIIFVCGRHADLQADLSQYQALKKKGTPAVLINGPREELDFPSVTVNYRQGVAQALAHLKSLGHRRIALVCGRDNAIPAQLLENAFTELTTADEELETCPIIPTFYTFSGGESAAASVKLAEATAVIAGSDLQALGVISGLEDLGYRVPEQISVIGFDDSTLMNHTSPALSTLRQPVVAMANAAVQLLEEQIDNAQAQSNHLTFSPDLVVRQSTAQPLN